MGNTKETFLGSDYVSPVIRTQHHCLYPDLYGNYLKLLQKTSFKEKYNKYAKTINEDVAELICDFS